MNGSFFDDMLELPDLSKVRDRGKKKWTAMMLTEHVSLLRQYVDDIEKVPRPQLDEFDLQMLQETIEVALKSKADTKLKLWRAGEFIYNRGIVEDIDLKRRIIKLEDPFKLHDIKIDEIVDVTIME